MLLVYGPILTAAPFPADLFVFVSLTVLLFIALFSSAKPSRPSPKIAYRSTEAMVQKYTDQETVRMLARELRDRDCLGKIGFDSCGYILTARNTRKAATVFRYSFHELGDIAFTPGEQEAILRALIKYLPDECDFRLYYEQPVSSDHPHFFYMKSKCYRRAESEGSL